MRKHQELMADKMTITSGATIRIQRASGCMLVIRPIRVQKYPQFECGMMKDSHPRSRPPKCATLRARSSSMATPWRIGVYVGLDDGASAYLDILNNVEQQ
jgi:hypothetical protein